MWSSKNYRRGRMRQSNSYNHRNNIMLNSSNTSSSENESCSKTNNLLSPEKIEKPECMQLKIDLALDDQIENWFRQLQKLCSVWKQPKNMDTLLNDLLRGSSNPFLIILKIINGYADNKSNKSKNIVILVLEEFKRWLKFEHSKHLTDDIKMACFNVICYNKNFPIVQLAGDIYQLQTIKENVLISIKYLLSSNQFKEACQMAIVLNYADDLFNVEDFIIPLILQDKLALAEEYLESRPKSQLNTINFLDNTLDRKSSVRNILDYFIASRNITGIRFEKLHSKPISKLLTRLLKQYNISDDKAPNLNHKRTQGLLNFLVHKRFVENSLGQDSWCEMVREAVKDNIKFQNELIYAVSIYDREDALNWAYYYNIKQDAWPMNLIDYYTRKNSTDRNRLNDKNCRGSSGSCGTNSENWDLDFQKKSLPTHAFPLSLNSIILINTEQLFQKLLDAGLMNVTIVGIDCEWKPSFGTQQTALSLVQIATKYLVFILDVFALGQEVPHLWRRLAMELFNNVNILKLGFGLSTDISMMQQSLPHLSNVYMQGAGYIDLLTLWKELNKIKQFKFPFPNEALTGSSLGSLVELCFGTHLNKSEQFSNWENRPLRQAQLIYASIDAYCLIEVFELLQQQCTQQNIQLDDLCNKIMNDTKIKKKAKKISNKNSNETSKSENIGLSQMDNNMVTACTTTKQQQKCSVKQICFVCDTMVQGLGKVLRQCGIDTIILDSYTHHDDCVKIANRENRFILTRGTVFNKLRQYVPIGHCYRVVSDNLDEQLEEVINFYNIEVHKEDIFSRCQMCNSGDFTTLTQSEISEIAKNQQHQQQYESQLAANSHFNNYYDQQNVWLDEASGFSSDDDNYFEEGTSAPTNKVSNLQTVSETNKLRADVSCIPEAVLKQVETFYVCRECAKVYWDGSHLDRILAGRLQNIVIEKNTS